MTKSERTDTREQDAEAQPDRDPVQERAGVARYLMMIAQSVASGAIDAFDLKWQNGMPKPLGPVLYDGAYLFGPPGQVLSGPRQPEPERKEDGRTDTERALDRTPAPRARIPVEDASAALKGVRSCGNPNCPGCGGKS